RHFPIAQRCGPQARNTLTPIIPKCRLTASHAEVALHAQYCAGRDPHHQGAFLNFLWLRQDVSRLASMLMLSDVTLRLLYHPPNAESIAAAPKSALRCQ